MTSPLPGMNPYLERPTIWPDVHLGLIQATRVTLAQAVAPRYYVAVEERTYIAAVDPVSFVGRPDVAVVGSPQPVPAASDRAPTAILEGPILVEVPAPDEVRERYLEIRDSTNDEVITVIEILSPSNKRPGEGRTRYEQKRRQVLSLRTNLVEIDLLRAGEPMPVSYIPASHYRILVSRGWQRPQAYLYPFNLRDPIPEIPVPLRRDEDEPSLALGELLTEVYDQARYDLRIDYTTEPDPPLSPDDDAWVGERLRQADLRT